MGLVYASITDGLVDFAVARQFAAPVFYHNTSKSSGKFIGLRLFHDQKGASAGTPGSPAVGAQVVVTTKDGRKFIDRVDGGSGHSGKRSTDVHIGLGNVDGPLSVKLCWRDRTGSVHEQTLELSTGWHDFQLGSQARER